MPQTPKLAWKCSVTQPSCFLTAWNLFMVTLLWNNAHVARVFPFFGHSFISRSVNLTQTPSKQAHKSLRVEDFLMYCFFCPKEFYQYSCSLGLLTVAQRVVKWVTHQVVFVVAELTRSNQNNMSTFTHTHTCLMQRLGCGSLAAAVSGVMKWTVSVWLLSLFFYFFFNLRLVLKLCNMIVKRADFLSTQVKGWTSKDTWKNDATCLFNKHFFGSLGPRQRFTAPAFTVWRWDMLIIPPPRLICSILQSWTF